MGQPPETERKLAMKRRNTILFTLLLAGLVPLAIRGCAAMLFVAVPAPVVGEERNFDITSSQIAIADTGSEVFAAGVDEATKTIASRRTKYAEAEKAVEKYVRSLGKKARTDAERAALRNLVAKAFEQRQELLRLELAGFQSRMNRLTQQLADRAEGREKVIDRRVDELLTPNLRWDEPAEIPAQTPENKKVAENALEPSSQEPLRRDDRELLSLRKRVAFAAELQGLWLAMEQGRNGEITPFKTNFTLTFNEKQQYAFREGDAEPYSLGTYSLPEVASGLPFAALDLTRTYLRQAGGPNPIGNPDQTHIEHAIVAIKGDTLRICAGGQRFNDRPDDFTTAKDDGRLLMVYRRVSRKLPAEFMVDPEPLPGEPPGLRPSSEPPKTQKREPLRPIETPLPEDKTSAEKIQHIFGFELKALSREAVGVAPFNGGLEIVDLEEKGPASLAGLRKHDILVGAVVWETLSLEHLQYAYEHRSSRVNPLVTTQETMELHLLRRQENGNELLRALLPLPKTEEPAPPITPKAGSLSPPADSSEFESDNTKRSSFEKEVTAHFTPSSMQTSSLASPWLVFTYSLPFESAGSGRVFALANSAEPSERYFLGSAAIKVSFPSTPTSRIFSSARIA